MKRWFGALLIGFAAGLGLATHCAETGRSKWEREADSLLAASLDSVHRAFRAERVVLSSQVAVAERQGRAARDSAERERAKRRHLAGSADSLRRSLDRAMGAADSLPVLVSLVLTQDSALESLQAENDHLRSTVDAQLRAMAHLRALVATHEDQANHDSVRIEELERLIRTRPPPPRCRVLGVGCGTVGVVAALGGVMLGQLLGR